MITTSHATKRPAAARRRAGFTLAEVMIAGALSTVVLAGSLAGHTNPIAVTVSAVCLSIGLLRLVLDARMPIAAAPTTPETEPVAARG